MCSTHSQLHKSQQTSQISVESADSSHQASSTAFAIAQLQRAPTIPPKGASSTSIVTAMPKGALIISLARDPNAKESKTLLKHNDQQVLMVFNGLILVKLSCWGEFFFPLKETPYLLAKLCTSEEYGFWTCTDQPAHEHSRKHQDQTWKFGVQKQRFPSSGGLPFLALLQISSLWRPVLMRRLPPGRRACGGCNKNMNQGLNCRDSSCYWPTIAWSSGDSRNLEWHVHGLQ